MTVFRLNFTSKRTERCHNRRCARARAGALGISAPLCGSFMVTPPNAWVGGAKTPSFTAPFFLMGGSFTRLDPGDLLVVKLLDPIVELYHQDFRRGTCSCDRYMYPSFGTPHTTTGTY